MDLLNPPKSDSTPIAHVALAIGIGNEAAPNQLHVGILHRGEPGIGILHLCWHKILESNEQYDNSMWWIVPPFLPERLQQVAMFCRRLSRTAGASSIAYGFGKYRDVFDFQTGTYRQLEGAGGLTCATFVLGVFHAARLPLLNDETWPKPSQADLDWEISIARTLASKEWSSKQAESVVSQVPAKRYQPHEVTAAALSDSLPATFEQIKGNAIEIKRLVLGRYLHNLMANEEYQRALPIADSILERFGLVPNSVEHQPDIVTLEYKNRYGLPKVMWLSLASNPSSGIVRLIDNQRLSMEADLDNIDEVIATFDRGESSQAQNRH